MNLLILERDKINGNYAYSFSANSPSNCKPIEYSSFSEIDLKGQFVLFIGSIWSGNLDVIIASVLADIAYNYPQVIFYFRIIVEEVEIEKLVPKELVFTHLPIVLFVENGQISTLSTGAINKEDFINRVEQILNTVPK